MIFKRRALPILSVAAAALLAACSSSSHSSSSQAAQTTTPVTLHLGYFPNLTHATAMIGLEKGYFAQALGKNVTIETHTFNAGGDAVTALLSGSIDVSFVGPSPTVNAFVQSHGEAVRVISGATSGGALLVVKQSINTPQDLRGKKIADPQLGNTQDVSLRWYLKGLGFNVDTHGGGDVSVLPQDNATTLQAFEQGAIDGAWVPEPWASRLVVEGGGKILVDERDLWPNRQFVTTDLVAGTQFLHDHPKRIKALLEGLYQANQYLNQNPSDAQSITNSAVAKISGKALKSGVVSAAWPHMTFTLDPLASSLKTAAAHAVAVGLLKSDDLTGLYDLTLLNEVLTEHGQSTVQGL